MSDWERKAKGRKPKSCFGLSYHFKLGRFTLLKKVYAANARPYLKLITRHGFGLSNFTSGNNNEQTTNTPRLNACVKANVNTREPNLCN